MRVLGEAYVSVTTIEGDMAHMVGQVFEAYKILFHVTNCRLKKERTIGLYMSHYSTRER